MFMQERRRQQRTPVESHLEIQPTGEIYWLAASSKDLSQYGMAFVTAVPLRVGDAICVGVKSVERKRRFLFDAVVRSVRREGTRHVIGVEFERKLSPVDLTVFTAAASLTQ